MVCPKQSNCGYDSFLSGCNQISCPLSRCAICNYSFVEKGTICEKCTKTCDACGKGIQYPYETLKIFNGDALCPSCYEVNFAVKSNTSDKKISESRNLKYPCTVCKKYFTLKIPYNGRTICKDCIDSQSKDVKHCQSCDELFYSTSDNDLNCARCQFECVSCGHIYIDVRPDRQGLCENCKTEDAVCVSCGELTSPDNLAKSGQCLNCLSRLPIRSCHYVGCTQEAIRNSDMCEIHDEGYMICPHCVKEVIRKEDLLCENCLVI